MKGALQLEERPELQPAAGEAVVQIRAAALNRRDWWITQGMYPGIELPCVLGSDGTGVVTKCGEGVDPIVSASDREGAFRCDPFLKRPILVVRQAILHSLQPLSLLDDQRESLQLKSTDRFGVALACVGVAFGHLAVVERQR